MVCVSAARRKMTITIQIWMLILGMSDLFLPGVKDVQLVLSNGDSPAMTMVARKEDHHWIFAMVDSETKVEKELGQLVRKKERLKMTLTMGGRSMSQTADLAQRVKDFQRVNWASVAQLEFDGNVVFALQRTKNKIAFSQPNGPTYTLQEIDPKQGRAFTSADITLHPADVSGPMKGWQRLKTPIVVTAADTYDRSLEKSSEPIAQGLMMLLSIIRNDGRIAEFLSHTMDQSMRDVLTKQRKGALGRLRKISIDGVAIASAASKNPAMQKMLTAIRNEVGDFAMVVAFTTGNDERRGYIFWIN